MSTHFGTIRDTLNPEDMLAVGVNDGLIEVCTFVDEPPKPDEDPCSMYVRLNKDKALDLILLLSMAIKRL